MPIKSWDFVDPKIIKRFIHLQNQKKQLQKQHQSVGQLSINLNYKKKLLTTSSQLQQTLDKIIQSQKQKFIQYLQQQVQYQSKKKYLKNNKSYVQNKNIAGQQTMDDSIFLGTDQTSLIQLEESVSDILFKQNTQLEEINNLKLKNQKISLELQQTQIKVRNLERNYIKMKQSLQNVLQNYSLRLQKINEGDQNYQLLYNQNQILREERDQLIQMVQQLKKMYE